jgi:hypothetical protein
MNSFQNRLWYRIGTYGSVFYKVYQRMGLSISLMGEGITLFWGSRRFEEKNRVINL